MEIVTFRAVQRRRHTKQQHSQPDQFANYHKLQDMTVTEDETHPRNFEEGVPPKKKHFHFNFGHRKGQSV